MTVFVKSCLNRKPVVRHGLLVGSLFLFISLNRPLLSDRLIRWHFLFFITLRIISRHFINVVFFGFFLIGSRIIRSGFAVAIGFIGHFRILRGRFLICLLGLLFIGRKRRLRYCLAIRSDDRGKIGGRCGFCPCAHRHTAECHAHRQHKRCKP
ncbi:MAG: hypothetical protein ACI4O4_06375, partial [Candidatus Ventricola sp.]